MTSGPGDIRRREFLTAIGRAAGGSAMLRTMAAMGIGSAIAGCGSSSAAPGNSPSPPSPPPPPPPAPPPGVTSPRPGDWPANVGAGKSVVILGAGIAGMTAALEMTRLGYACTLLEATARAGGRNRTIRGGDTVLETDSSRVCMFDIDDELYFNPGPARIPHHHEFLLGYCREFGVALEAFVNENSAALLHSPASFGGEPQLLRHVKADSRGNIARLLAMAVDQGALDQELSAAERNQLVAILRSFGDLNGANDYTGSSRAGFPDQENTGSRRRGQQVAPLPFEQLLSESFWEARQDFTEGLNQQPTMLQPVGGMDRIAVAFQARVGQDIVYEAEVTEIRKTGSGARVVYLERGVMNSIDADHCICTIPATVLRNIPNDFSGAHNSEINNFSYASAGKTAFQSRRFWEQDHNIYGGISWTAQDITQIWYPSGGYGQANGVVVGAYIFGGQPGNDFAAQSPEARVNTTVSQASAVHGNFGVETLHGVSVAWPKVPYQLGAWGLSTPNTLLRADDSIYFAGEHLSMMQGWQEGAILSAYHAIDLAVSRDSV